jgi:16S rRNA (guanine527-N7)-methyltransferase
MTCELAPFGPDSGGRAAAEAFFGVRLPLAARYAGWLVGPGVTRGVLGPREAGRLWDRHLLNGALLAELVPTGAHLVDLGSGGGLPGLVLALARPDLRVTLLDSMLRRTTFLTEVVDDLALADRVEVVRARAEETRLAADVVTARAVSGLGTLAAWSAGLVRVGGLLLAQRGAAARTEIAADARPLRAAGWQDVEVVERTHEGVTPTLVVRATRR